MIKCDTLIRGGCIITMDPSFRILENHDLAIKDGKIMSFSPSGSLDFDAREIINAENCLITPGFINAHTHMPMTYFRGLADDLPLDKWLQEYIWPLESKMVTPEFVYDASLHAAAEMLCNGITLANDMYFHNDRTADACIEAGIRVIVSEAVISHTFSGPLSAIGDSIRSMRDRYAGQPLVDFALAPHAIYTCDRDMLAEMAAIAAADNLMIHMHLSETESEVENCLKEHKMLPVEYLKDLGYLEQRCIFAHGVWLSEKELDLMQGTNCGIAVCTDSNLKLSSGFLPLKAIRERGIKAAMASDGVASNNNLDILEELSTTAKLHKALNHDPEFLPARDAFAMLTIDAAKALGKDAEVGSLEPDKAADLCIINTHELQGQPLYNPYSHLVYALSSRHIRDVMVAGKLVVNEYRPVFCNTEDLLDRARYWKEKIVREIGL